MTFLRFTVLKLYYNIKLFQKYKKQEIFTSQHQQQLQLFSADKLCVLHMLLGMV